MIAPTLGARGRKVIIQNQYTSPDIVDDGYKTITEVNLEDPKEQLGVELLKEVSSRTNDKQGDGTTTTMVIASTLINGVIKDEGVTIGKEKGNVLKLRRELEAGSEKVIEYINKNKLDIKPDNKDDLFNIAKVSSNRDEVGKILADVYSQLGVNASILTENANTLDTTYEITEGLKIDRGYVSPTMVTKRRTMEAMFEDTEILVTDYKLDNISMFLGFMNKIAQANIPKLVVIADDFSGIVLNSLVANNVQGTYPLLAIKAPGFGNQKDILEDIAIFIGAKFISKDDSTVNLADFNVEWLGKADKIVSDKDKTIFIGGKGDNKLVKERIDELKVLFDKETSEYEKEKLRERMSNMDGGIAKIKVGGATEMEQKERSEKLDDSIHSVRNALMDGIVPGGGVILLRASEILSDEIEGEKLLKKAIQKPFEQILDNGDLDSAKIKDKVMANENKNYGFDVDQEQYGDMIKMGIIDPASVVKSALQNALSVSVLLLTSSGSIVLIEKEEDDKK